MKKIINFKNISVVVLLAGLAIWGIVGWNIYQEKMKEAQRVPIGGSSDMIRRTMAINEAIENGENSYLYETNEMPMMPGLDQEASEQVIN